MRFCHPFPLTAGSRNGEQALICHTRIPDRLLNSLCHHKATVSANHALVFATSNGGIVHNFLRQCKSVAWRAGLNCGLCDTGQGHCAKGPYCQNWFLHKFRATFATMHLRAGVDLRTVQAWMGHKDLESTMRYLKPARDKEALQKVNGTFPLPRPTPASDDAYC